MARRLGLLLVVWSLGAPACRSGADGGAGGGVSCVETCAAAIAVCSMPCSFDPAGLMAYTAYAQCLDDQCSGPCADASGCPLDSAACEQCAQASCQAEAATCMSQ